MRVVVLGAGFGGLELTTRLSEELGDDVDVVLIDQSDGFVFGFSKLDVMFGRTTADAVFHPYRRRREAGRAVRAGRDPVDRPREQAGARPSAGAFEGDILVVALGADLDPGATPGLRRGRLRVLHRGRRVRAPRRARRLRRRTRRRRRHPAAVQVPARAERDRAAVHELLVTQGRARPVGGLAGDAVAGADPAVARRVAGAARGVRRARHHLGARTAACARSIPARQVAILTDDSELPYDLFLGIPVHVAPPVVVESGLTVDGWIPVDPATLETSFPDVYAVGDVTSVGTPEGGRVLRGAGQGRRRRDHRPPPRRRRRDLRRPRRLLHRVRRRPGGQGRRRSSCPGRRRPASSRPRRSRSRATRPTFGAERIRRWFGREWSNV